MGRSKCRVIFTNAGFASANPEVDDYTRGVYRLAAAVYLYALTGESKYRDYVETNFNSAHALQWNYWYAFEPMIQDALLYYTKLPGVPESTLNAINTSKQNSMNGGEFLQAVNNSTDAYRAYLKTGDYTWGSNRNKSHVGLIFINQAVYGIDASNAATYRTTSAVTCTIFTASTREHDVPDEYVWLWQSKIARTRSTDGFWIGQNGTTLRLRRKAPRPAI